MMRWLQLGGTSSVPLHNYVCTVFPACLCPHVLHNYVHNTTVVAAALGPSANSRGATSPCTRRVVTLATTLSTRTRLPTPGEWSAREYVRLCPPKSDDRASHPRSEVSEHTSMRTTLRLYLHVLQESIQLSQVTRLLWLVFRGRGPATGRLRLLPMPRHLLPTGPQHAARRETEGFLSWRVVGGGRCHF